MSQNIRHPVTLVKTSNGWEPVRDAEPVRNKTKIWIQPNWTMIALFLLAIPATAFLLQAPPEEELTETCPPIVDSLGLYPMEHDFTEPNIDSPLPVSSEESKFAEWMWYLKVREGFVPSIYRCPAGIRTIGYGHNVEVHGTKKLRLTYQEASKLLYDDIEKQYNQVSKLLPHLNRNQKLAVTSLAANCGLAKIMYTRGNSRKGYSDFWKACRLGKAPNFEDYTKYRTPQGKIVKSPNLISARNFEKLLFQGHGKLPILVGFKNGRPVYRPMTFEDAALLYQQQLIKRDILPAKQGGYY